MSLVLDAYPLWEKEGDWSVKTHTMQRSLVGRARARIRRDTKLRPRKTTELENWTFDPGGIYCTKWPEVTVVDAIVSVDMAALHLPEFIEAMGRAKEEAPGCWYIQGNQFHLLVVSPERLRKLHDAADRLRPAAARLMDEFNAKADQMTRSITEKKANGESVIVDRNGLVEIPPGRN